MPRRIIPVGPVAFRGTTKQLRRTSDPRWLCGVGYGADHIREYATLRRLRRAKRLFEARTHVRLACAFPVMVLLRNQTCHFLIQNLEHHAALRVKVTPTDSFPFLPREDVEAAPGFDRAVFVEALVDTLFVLALTGTQCAEFEMLYGAGVYTSIDFDACSNRAAEFDGFRALENFVAASAGLPKTQQRMLTRMNQLTSAARARQSTTGQ